MVIARDRGRQDRGWVVKEGSRTAQQNRQDLLFVLQLIMLRERAGPHWDKNWDMNDAVCLGCVLCCAVC